MVKKNRGHVVAISSIAGLFGAPYGTIYCPSKFAVRGKNTHTHTFSMHIESVQKSLWIYSIN